MEKSLEQLRHIQRISRQTRHHRMYLNQLSDQHLRTQLNQLANEREQSIQRSASRREIEEERKQLLSATVKQLARERQQKPLPIETSQIEEEKVQVLSQDDDSRPSSAVRLSSPGTSCRLFSHDCQLYPCQPIYQYTSFVKKEKDRILQSRASSARSYVQEPLTTLEDKKYQQNRRQLALAKHNQDHEVNRHVSIRRTMATLDEQSRLLHQRLAEKNTFGYVKERQQQLSQAIQRHLKITAKFCT